MSCRGRSLVEPLLTGMKLAGIRTGLLINFNVTKLKNGNERFVSDAFVRFVSFVVKKKKANIACT